MKVKLSALCVPNNFFYDFNEKQKTKQTKAKQQQKPSKIRERFKVMSGLKTHVLGAIKKTECTIK